MRKELDDLLCERYPDLFCNRRDSRFESGMHYGFACGDGWFELINNLCAAITSNVKTGASPPVIAMQVKEKLGRLRFRSRGGTDEIRRLVEFAEDLSETTCEACGQSEAAHINVQQGVLCPECLAR